MVETPKYRKRIELLQGTRDMRVTTDQQRRLQLVRAIGSVMELGVET